MPRASTPEAHWNAYRPTYSRSPSPSSPIPASLTDLIGRTTRAYDLVIAYTRDSEGGTRWSVGDIARVHAAGKQLWAVIRVLKEWEDVDERDWDFKRIKDDGRDVKEVCEGILELIGETERKGEWEIEAERQEMYRRVRALEEEAKELEERGMEKEEVAADEEMLKELREEDEHYDNHSAPQSPDLSHDASGRSMYDMYRPSATYRPSRSASRQHTNRHDDVYKPPYANDKRARVARRRLRRDLRRKGDDLYRPGQAKEVERLGNHVVQRPQARNGDDQEDGVERLGNHIIQR